MFSCTNFSAKKQLLICSGYTSRFLNKSKSTAVVTPEDEKDEDSDSKYGTGRTRYMALKERRNRLARSRSSHQFGNDDDDDEPASPTTVSPAAYIASRCAFLNTKTHKKKHTKNLLLQNT